MARIVAESARACQGSRGRYFRTTVIGANLDVGARSLVPSRGTVPELASPHSGRGEMTLG